LEEAETIIKYLELDWAKKSKNWKCIGEEEK